jgi:hypothetical protein
MPPSDVAPPGKLRASNLDVNQREFTTTSNQFADRWRHRSCGKFHGIARSVTHARSWRIARRIPERFAVLAAAAVATHRNALPGRDSLDAGRDDVLLRQGLGDDPGREAASVELVYDLFR